MDPDIPYLLLTPGPLTTSRTVREAMLTDYSTWDVDYNAIVTRVRDGIVRLATSQPGYTCTLVQGSGTFAVEATIGSTVPAGGKILIVNNGAYGKRMVETAQRLRIVLPLAEVVAELANVRRVEPIGAAIHTVAVVVPAAIRATRKVATVAIATCLIAGLLAPLLSALLAGLTLLSLLA